VLVLDSLAAFAICRAIGCRIRGLHLAALPLWSLARGLAWIVCWLPWPILWRGQEWWSSRRPPAPRDELLEPESQLGFD